MNHLTGVVAAACVAAALAPMTNAAWWDGIKPTASSAELAPLDRVATRSTPALDFKQIADEDADRERLGLAPRYAVPHEVFITPEIDGSWEMTDNGLAVWRLRIESPNAVSINLGFTRYFMPKGGKLFIYSSDMTQVIRPFTAMDNEDHGQLWTPPVDSDSIVIELTVPAAQRERVQLELGFINLGYKTWGEISDRSGSCNVDVVCPEGDDWRDEIASVGVISTGGSTFCTGFMVNNAEYDLTPYFMTANHCGISSGNAASLVVFWNYENSTCRPPGSPESGGPGDGTLDQFNTGSTFLASYSPSDFTLVVLDDSPQQEWYVSYAGWDATGADATTAIAIHHPSTDEKRISFEFDGTATSSYLGESVPGDGTHVWVPDWDIGTTEPGSSGSPLFDQDHRVIGQLHGGYAACGNDLADWYGKFSVSWNNGLSDHLDPLNTGVLTVDTLSTRGITVTPSGETLHLGPVGGPFTNDTVVYTLSNNTAEPADYEVRLTNFIGILLDGGTAPLSGTIPAQSDTTFTVTLAPGVNTLPQGIYDEVIEIEDLDLGLVKTREHTIEVGTTGFTTSPEDPFESSGPLGGPFDDTITYTITSTRPTPVQVTVAASDSWISLNGGSGPVVETLNGIGDFADITVGFSSAADSLPNGIALGAVTFTNDDGGAGDASRQVVLDVGRLVYNPNDVPQAINDNSTITSSIIIEDEFCIGDVDVVMDVSHTYIGDLIIELASPTGVVVRLHDRTGGSDNDIVATYDDDGEGILPDGPGALADFNLTGVEGTWTLTISDNAGADQGSLNDWALRISPIEGDCPDPVLVHSFPLDADPGWATEGQWAYGQPTGNGGSSGGPDPTSGATGPNVYGYNLNGDYVNNMPEYHLTTGAIDCTGVTNTRLRFQRWLGVESSSYDHARVQVSNNGTSWTTLWENGSSFSDSAWTQQSYDISAVADGQSTVYFRWIMGDTDGSVTYCGWNIDDVEVWGIVPNNCPADFTGDDQINADDLFQLLGAWGACPGCPQDLTDDDIVNADDLFQLLGAWGPC